MLTQVISKKASERVEEWRTALKPLVGSNKSVTFALGDEPEDLIEDVSARIAIQMEMEAEEENMDEDND